MGAWKMGGVAVGAALMLSMSGALGAQETPAGERSGDRTGRLEEVVVTAQRREENIQDVPVAVTAANAETLSELRVGNVENLNILTPSISFRKTNISSSSSNIQIRGIGTTGNARTFEGAVGVFIDGVYRTRAGQALSNFLDIDNLQVLRGPQGTLFGKNTAAGALLLTSAAPTFDGVTGFVEASHASFDSVSVKGAVNLPLSDRAAFRIAAVHVEEDGYIDNPNGGTLNNIERQGIKAQFALEPTDDLSIRLIGDFNQQDDDCCYGTVDVVDGPLQGLVDGLSIANGLEPPSRRPSDLEAVSFPDTPNEIEDFGGTLLVDYHLPLGTLKSVTGYRVYDVFQIQDADFSGADILDLDETFRSDFFSQEFTFEGQLDGPLMADFVVGVYYSDEDLDMGRELRHGSQAQAFWDVVFAGAGVPPGTAAASAGLLSSEEFSATSESLAVFTHWDFQLDDQWNVIVGARYSDDEKTGSFVNPFFRSPLDPLALAGVMPGLEYRQEFSDEAVTGTVSVQYRPSADAMLYASYNRGYKAGGVNLDVNAAGVPGAFGDPNFDAEIIDAYEIGAKFDWLDGRARTNVAAFYNDIEDLQVAQFLGLQFAIVNAPSAKVHGAEIEQTFMLNSYLTTNVSATWLGEADFGSAPVLGHLADRRFSTAPRLAANASLNLDYPLDGGAVSLIGWIQAQYTSEVYTNTASNLKQEAVTLLNANLGVNFEETGLSLSAFVRNATDRTYLTQHFNTPLQDVDRNAYIAPPRTFGLMVRQTF